MFINRIDQMAMTIYKGYMDSILVFVSRLGLVVRRSAGKRMGPAASTQKDKNILCESNP